LFTAADVTKSRLHKEFDVAVALSGGAKMEEVGTQTTLKRPSKRNSTDCTNLSITSTCKCTVKHYIFAAS